MKLVSFLVTTLIYCNCTFAKTSEADKLFDNWDYSRASRLYQKEALVHPGADVYFKLGECYRKMNLYKEEQAAYDKVQAYGVYSKPEFYLNYGQVLRSNGRNEEAKIAFDKYNELEPLDQRGNFFSRSIDIVALDHKWDEPVAIHNVAQFNTPDADLCPVPYKDGVVFTSNRKSPGRNKIYGWTGANYPDLYFAKKGASALDYSGVTTFGGNKIIKKFNDGPACFSKNFDTIYISRVNRDMKGSNKKTLGIDRVKIFMSAMVAGSWTKPVPFYLNSDHYSVANPFLSSDGSRLYFASDMPGGYGETDIYYCDRAGTAWGPPINMGPNVNTCYKENFPTLDSAGNCYFASDGYQGFGGLDICVARNNSGVLAKAIPLKYPFNTPQDDFGIVFLGEGKTGYISSNRTAGGHGDDDIYYFDLRQDKVDTTLLTSDYTIGYRPRLRQPVTTPVLAAVPAAGTKEVLPNDIVVHFDFDKQNIRPDAIPHLDSAVYIMTKYPELTLFITGNCDCRGTSDYNRRLAIRRSDATLSYLQSKGIMANRMAGEGYGTKRTPIHCSEATDNADDYRQLDRRAYIHFEPKTSVLEN